MAETSPHGEALVGLPRASSPSQAPKPRASVWPKLNAAPLSQAVSFGWGRGLLLGLVLLYLGAALIGPLLALASELVSLGIPAIVESLLRPEALAALRMTLGLTAIALVVNAVVGTLGAVVLTRHRFMGRG